MTSSYDHILIIGFGGPEKAEDVLPFLKIVTEGRNIPEARLKSVAHHYDAIGGFSPYNHLTFQLVEKINMSLSKSGVSLPVFTGMRNWHPFLKDTLNQIKEKGYKKGLGVILSGLRSEASCKRYKENVEEAKKVADAENIEYVYLPAWHQNPRFISAQADHVKQTLESIPQQDREGLQILFTAHSIPLVMNEACSHCLYSEDYKKAAWFVASACGLDAYEITYQSRSGNPRMPWLDPDVCEVIKAKKGAAKAVLVIPIGFLCDNAEVLYDLDIEAKQAAEESGLKYYRAKTVTDHPDFVEMFTKLIQEKIEDSSLEEKCCKV